jgi:hypothetical protein
VIERCRWALHIGWGAYLTTLTFPETTESEGVAEEHHLGLRLKIFSSEEGERSEGDSQLSRRGEMLHAQEAYVSVNYLTNSSGLPRTPEIDNNI